MDRLLDNACAGPLYLRRPEIATMAVEAIRYRQQNLKHYQIHAYVVMANHVHLLITPYVEISQLMQSLKRFTAREGNRMLGRTGQPFWQAGLAAKPEDFPWSSARPIHNRPAG